MKVTIGIPFYNNEATLQDAICSVLAQSYTDWELLLVDDGSIDASLDIAYSYQCKDNRIRVISDGTNKGLSYRLNQIVSSASGIYIARMDSDDIMHPERIRLQLEYLCSHPSVDVIDSAVYVIDEHNRVTGRRGTEKLRTKAHEVLSNGLFIHPTIFGRTEWFKRHPYHVDYVRAEDHELWVRTLAYSTFDRLERPLYFYREPSRVNLRNYTLSCKTDRKILKNYGRQELGRLLTAGLLMKSVTKETVYRLFHRLHISYALVHSRSQSLTEEEKERATMDLQKAVGTA